MHIGALSQAGWLHAARAMHVCAVRWWAPLRQKTLVCKSASVALKSSLTVSRPEVGGDGHDGSDGCRVMWYTEEGSSSSSSSGHDGAAAPSSRRRRAPSRLAQRPGVSCLRARGRSLRMYLVCKKHPSPLPPSPLSALLDRTDGAPGQLAVPAPARAMAAPGATMPRQAGAPRSGMSLGRPRQTGRQTPHTA